MGILVATLFVPTGYTIIPIVQVSLQLGLIDSLAGMILALSGAANVSAILIYAGYFRQMPKELEEAAVVDGAGFLRIFFSVMLPLAMPVTATVAVLTFLATWNAFFLPLVFSFSRPELRTLSVGMQAFVGENADRLDRHGRRRRDLDRSRRRALHLPAAVLRRRNRRSSQVHEPARPEPRRPLSKGTIHVRNDASPLPAGVLGPCCRQLSSVPVVRRTRQRPAPEAGGGGAGALDWWDHFSSFQKLHDDWATKQSEALGTNVTYTYYEASKAPEALQLANRPTACRTSTPTWSGSRSPRWSRTTGCTSSTSPKDILAKLPKGLVTEGITNIDGKLYGLPLFSFRQYTAVTWFNTDHFAKARLDPNSPPATYDGFRDACQKLKAAGIAPMTLAIGADGGRVRDEIDDMAQTGGFPGYQGLKFTTGEYAVPPRRLRQRYRVLEGAVRRQADAAGHQQLQCRRRPDSVCLRCGRVLHRRPLVRRWIQGPGSRRSCRRSAAARS